MISYKKFLLIILSSVCAYTLIVFLFNSSLVFPLIQRQVISNAEALFGSKKFNSEFENKIKDLANKLGINEDVEIRKMNSCATKTFGYCNACVYFPSICYNIIPICKPFLFISEGFFEDISPEEQKFLIGHELTHVKYHDLFAIHQIMWVLFIILLSFVYFFCIKSNHSIPNIVLTLIISIITISIVLRVLYCQHSRNIERRADYESLHILDSHEGGLKVIERWEKERMSHPISLISTHPSLDERKVYCLKK